MALISAVPGEIAELTCVLNDDSMLKQVSATSLIKTSALDGEELTSWKPSPSEDGFSHDSETSWQKVYPIEVFVVSGSRQEASSSRKDPHGNTVSIVLQPRKHRPRKQISDQIRDSAFSHL